LRIVVESSALTDVGIFTVTEGKIKGIQEELDSCWAVLGEVYGRIAPLNKLNLRLRRVRSNLRAPSIIDQLPFIPYNISLESARSDLLKLLIEPLYGDSPAIGIRELVQNAIDAIREFEFIVSKKPSLLDVDREKLDGDVVVFFKKDDKDEVWITVADRGIGMTWETVSKYYLTAGASFRKSDAWKKEFTDETGKSKVLRSGRFGIGILSAFLLGNRVMVSTRNLEEPEDRGIQFEFGIEDTNIELRWIKRSIGTTISVKSSESILSRLHKYKYYYSSYFYEDNWDWYCLDKPVLIRLDRYGKKIKSGYRFPSEHGPLPSDWHRIQSPAYQSIDWSYSGSGSKLVCNGIRIPRGAIDLKKEFSHLDYPYRKELILKSPNVSVFDPDGRLPLNLARDSLARESTGFESLLADDVCRNFIAFCLTKGPLDRILIKDHWRDYTELKYPGCYSDFPMGHFFDSRQGFGLSDAWNVSQFSSTKCLLIRKKRFDYSMSEELIEDTLSRYDIIFASASDSTLTGFDSWHRKLLNHNSNECLPIFKNIDLKGFRTIMPNEWYSRLVDKQPKFIMNYTKLEKSYDFGTAFTVGHCSKPDPDFVDLVKNLKNEDFSYESITEIYLTTFEEYPAPGRISQMWKEVIGGPIIPFDKLKRQKIIAQMDDKFSRHLAEWTSKED
jgi:hypothetical protein